MLYAFSILYALPQFFLLADYPFQAIQVLTIASFFFMGALVAQYQLASKNFVDYSNRFVLHPKVFYYIFFFFVLSRLGTISDIVASLMSGEFMSFALNNAVQRYTNHEEATSQTILQRLGLIAFLMSGSVAASIKTQRFKIHVLLFIMILVESAVLARLGVLIVFVTYFVEFLIKNNVRLQDLSFISMGRIGLILLSILVAIFLFSAYGRISDKDDGILEILVMKFYIYTIAMYEALLIWMQNNSDQYGSTYGSGTFAGALKILGFEFEQGFYKPVSTRYGETNIYTNIRGFLSDFGLVGSCILMSFFGYLISLYSKKNMSFLSYNTVRLIMTMLIFSLFSPLIHFNTLCALLLSGVIIAGVRFAKN